MKCAISINSAWLGLLLLSVSSDFLGMSSGSFSLTEIMMVMVFLSNSEYFSQTIYLIKYYYV